MATVNCEPCKTEGKIQHSQPEAQHLAKVHDDRVHRGGSTAKVKG